MPTSPSALGPTALRKITKGPKQLRAARKPSIAANCYRAPCPKTGRRTSFSLTPFAVPRLDGRPRSWAQSLRSPRDKGFCETNPTTPLFSIETLGRRADRDCQISVPTTDLNVRKQFVITKRGPEAIARTMEQNNWNRQEAARILDISYKALLYIRNASTGSRA